MLQTCPMDCSPLTSSVHGIFQRYWSGLPFPPPGRSTTWFSNSTAGYIPKIHQITILNRCLYPHFTVALFTIAKTWRHCKGPWVNERIKKKWHIHTHTHIYRGKLFSHKKEGILLAMTTWTDLKGIMLGQMEKDKYCTMSLTRGI